MYNSTPCPVATTQRSTDSRYFTAKSVITGLQSDDEEGKHRLFQIQTVLYFYVVYIYVCIYVCMQILN